MSFFSPAVIILTYFIIGGVWGVILSKKVATRIYNYKVHFFQEPLAALMCSFFFWPMGVYIIVFEGAAIVIGGNFKWLSKKYTRLLTKTDKPEADKGRIDFG